MIVKFKTRIEWGFFRAAIVGALLAVLAVPAGMVLVENPFASRVKVIINGDLAAVADSVDHARAAFKTARLAYNRDGLRILDLEVDYQIVPFDAKDEAVKGMKILRDDELVDAISERLSAYEDKNKSLAYTMRIDDYIVTVADVSEIVGVLEQAQDKYDEKNDFGVGLILPENHNLGKYEVAVTEKSKRDDGAETAEDGTSKKKKDLAEQAKNDGIKNVGFSDKIEVVTTYVDRSLISDKKSVYDEMMEEKGEAGIYVIKPGDTLSVIAENNGMSIEEVKEMNPQIESDEDLYYDDRLNVLIPTAAVSVVVEKQETYEEEYYAPVEYEDDGSMYIGDSIVIQDGVSGKHIVTDLVTYTGTLETGRQMVEETVEVAAVPQIVLRGTKSRPTYMYPVSNWNVTSTFGQRWGRLHAGTDVGIPVGTTVRASRSGQVVTAGWVGGYGNCVMIDHGDGITTVYGHLSQVLVSVGQYVDQGEQIALSGNTGRSTGPHLHFEVRVNGSATDATPYLEGWN